MYFSKRSDRLSSTGPEILAFGSHCSANFQPISNYFIPDFILKYEDPENVKTGCLNTGVFNLHEIKEKSFWDTIKLVAAG